MSVVTDMPGLPGVTPRMRGAVEAAARLRNRCNEYDATTLFAAASGGCFRYRPKEIGGGDVWIACEDYEWHVVGEAVILSFVARWLSDVADAGITGRDFTRLKSRRMALNVVANLKSRPGVVIDFDTMKHLLNS